MVFLRRRVSLQILPSASLIRIPLRRWQKTQPKARIQKLPGGQNTCWGLARDLSGPVIAVNRFLYLKLQSKFGAFVGSTNFGLAICLPRNQKSRRYEKPLRNSLKALVGRNGFDVDCRVRRN